MAGGQTQTNQHSGQTISFDATVDGGTFSVGGNVGNGPAEFHHSGSASGPGTQVGVSLDGSPAGALGLNGDKLMVLEKEDLQNLISFKKLVKKGKKAVKVGKGALKVAKDAKHTYDDIKALRLVNLNDIDNRDAANRDHDFEMMNLGGNPYKDMMKAQRKMMENQQEAMAEAAENGMMHPMMGNPYAMGGMNPMMMNPAMAGGMSGYMNLDTELDYYHSDGRTDFTGNRNTRTYIKDVSMGPSSSTSFGLVQLDEDLSDDEDKNSIDFEVESDDELDLEDLMVNCAVYGDHPMCAGFEDLQNLSMFSKMKKGMSKVGKGLKKFEKGAVAAREMGKKYYPQAEQAWAIVAPKAHDKYAPKLAKGYKTFNEKANKMGGWNTVDKAADALQSVGLVML